MRINIKVKPNSKEKKLIKISDKEYQANLKSAPEKNKANLELLKTLTKHFKKKVKIIKGKTSKNKVVEIT